MSQTRLTRRRRRATDAAAAAALQLLLLLLLCELQNSFGLGPVPSARQVQCVYLRVDDVETLLCRFTFRTRRWRAE